MRKRSTSALLALGLTVTQAHAALITWYGQSTITSASDVATSGIFVAAEGGYSSTLVINGVTFDTAAESNAISFGGSLSGGFGSGAPTGDANFDTLLRDGYYTSNPGTPETLTLSGLTIGVQYRVQVFIGVWDNNYPTTLSDGTTSINMLNAANTPTFSFGTFTADGTEQTFTYNGTGGDHGIISAIALYSVIPEPSTYAAIAGAAAFGLVILRRRRAV